MAKDGEAHAMVKDDPAEANEPADLLDLRRIVAEIDADEIKTAADLEARLTGDGAPKIDADGDGKPDHLHVVERRTSTSTTFEIRATAAEDTSTEIGDATLVATLELVPDPDHGEVELTASYASSYAASASIDVETTTVHHRTHGVAVHAEGEFDVTAEAGFFVSWAFRPGRPVFVAHVFIVHEHDHYHDHGCWPPGHCKHGKWKAHGGLPPGQAKKHSHSHSGHGVKVKVKHSGPKGHSGHKFKGKHKHKGH